MAWCKHYLRWIQNLSCATLWPWDWHLIALVLKHFFLEFVYSCPLYFRTVVHSSAWILINFIHNHLSVLYSWTHPAGFRVLWVQHWCLTYFVILMRCNFKCFQNATTKRLDWWLLSYTTPTSTSCATPALSTSCPTSLRPLFIVRVFLRWLCHCITKTCRLGKIWWCYQPALFKSWVPMSQSSWCTTTACKSVWSSCILSWVGYTNNWIGFILVKKWDNRYLVFFFLFCPSSIFCWWIKS